MQIISVEKNSLFYLACLFSYIGITTKKLRKLCVYMQLQCWEQITKKNNIDKIRYLYQHFIKIKLSITIIKII